MSFLLNPKVMKNFIKSIALALILAGLIMLHSCENSVLNPQEVALPSTLSVVDGRLVFQNMEVYRETLEHLAANENTLDAWEQQFAGYTSITTAYRRITVEEQEKIAKAYVEEGSLAGFENVLSIVRDSEGELEEVCNIGHPMIARTVNQFGLMQIGDTLYKYTYGHVIRLGDPDERQVKLLQRSHEGNMPDIGIPFPVKRSTREVTTLRADGNTCTQSYNNGRRRVRGEINEFEAPGSQGWSAETKHQRKVLGIWWGDECPQLRVQGSGTVQWGSVVETVNVDFTDFDVSSTGGVNLSICITPCIPGPVDLDVTHSSSCGGGIACNTACN